MFEFEDFEDIDHARVALSKEQEAEALVVAVKVGATAFASALEHARQAIFIRSRDSDAGTDEYHSPY